MCIAQLDIDCRVDFRRSLSCALRSSWKRDGWTVEQLLRIELMQKQNSISDRFPLVEARHVLSSSQRIHVYTDLNSVWSSLELQGVKNFPKCE